LIYISYNNVISGVDIKRTLKRKFDEACVEVNNSDVVINRMATHILASRADTTVDKYAHHVKHFKDFCASKGFSYIPAQSIHVAMYLSCMIDTGNFCDVLCNEVVSQH
jgi:hypothetical protein